MLPEALAGRRIAVTGATGFLGTALAERLLRSVPDCQIALLVRPGRRGAADRVRREILRNNCFDRLRRELGDGFDAEMDRRILVMAGDVGVDGLGLDAAGGGPPRPCPTVIHSAATVSFDSPLDSAVEINLLGPTRVAETLSRLHAARRPDRPHLIAVSTAYVAGSRRGGHRKAALADTPWSTDVAWRPEVATARRARADTDAESRDRRCWPASTQAGASSARRASAPRRQVRKLREDWIKRPHGQSARPGPRPWAARCLRLHEGPGRAGPARDPGRPAGHDRRPSIIEVALAEPEPGWIRGFRMADPVMISYGKGLLKAVPRRPGGRHRRDPVDLVVAAILAVAAGPLAEPDVFHAASGARNPLRYRQLVDLVRPGS